MDNEWIDEIVKGAEQLDAHALQKKKAALDKRKLFESRLGAIRTELRDLLGDAVRFYNSKVAEDAKIAINTPPHLVFEAGKTKYPAGNISVDIDQENEMIICEHYQRRSGDVEAHSYTVTYKINVGETDFGLLSDTGSISKQDMARELLEGFFKVVAWNWQ